jgi:succinate dehydrogenase / fumarate reductase, cytochrome b subunit
MSDSTLRLASISKKISMAIAGLFLILFLIVHLGINLLMLLPDEGKLFAEAAHFMGTNPLIKIFEVVLFAGFILHIIFGIIVWYQNRQARPVRYHSTNKSDTSFLSKFMIHTGVVIGIFIVIHLANFYFVKLGLTQPIGGDYSVTDKHDFLNMARNLFSNVGYSAFYIVALLLMGFHLNHALQSAFQSLGWNHPRYTPWIKRIGIIYSVVVSAGFIIIPLYFLLTL